MGKGRNRKGNRGQAAKEEAPEGDNDAMILSGWMHCMNMDPETFEEERPASYDLTVVTQLLIKKGFSLKRKGKHMCYVRLQGTKFEQSITVACTGSNRQSKNVMTLLRRADWELIDTFKELGLR